LNLGCSTARVGKKHSVKQTVFIGEARKNHFPRLADVGTP
jgi:hypothetical protein